MSKLSAIVITYNEENNIKDCLETLKWADEIIVVDSNSTDKTVEIAKQYTKNVLNTDNNSYSYKRNIAIEAAKSDWILWIDADERVTDSLREEIKNIINKPEFDAYKISRKSFFINKFIKHCGWTPDFGLRLFRKSTGIRFNDLRVHENVVFEGKTGKLKSPILHYTDLTFEHYINKMNTYTTSSSMDLKDSGRKASLSDIIFRPFFTFLKMYFLKLGIFDGYTGLVLCTLSVCACFCKIFKIILFNTKKCKK